MAYQTGFTKVRETSPIYVSFVDFFIAEFSELEIFQIKKMRLLKNIYSQTSKGVSSFLSWYPLSHRW